MGFHFQCMNFRYPIATYTSQMKSMCRLLLERLYAFHPDNVQIYSIQVVRLRLSGQVCRIKIKIEIKNIGRICIWQVTPPRVVALTQDMLAVLQCLHYHEFRHSEGIIRYLLGLEGIKRRECNE